MIDNLTILSKNDFLFFANKDINSIAIVGNGPTENGDRQKINSADLVIRFNDWASRDHHRLVKKTGNRCDFLFTTIDSFSRRGNQPSKVIIGIPYPHHYNKVEYWLNKQYPNSQYIMVNPYLNFKLCKELNLNSIGWNHPLPTIGMTGIWHINHFSLSANIYITGFSWLYDEKTDSIQNQLIDSEILPQENHIYIKEAFWISKKLFNNDKWTFSSIAKKTLNRVHNLNLKWTKELNIT